MSTGKRRIAILGATSHIAKGLIVNFIRNKSGKLYLFSRSPRKVKKFLGLNGLKAGNHIYGFGRFDKGGYDVIINCVGLGAPARLRKEICSVFRLTEEFDNKALNYLFRHPRTIYINFSSGAVYNIVPAEARPEDYYGIAKLYQEAKHRAMGKLRIIDIRVFSYFSRFIDLDSGFFLTDLIRSLKQKKIFTTNSCDFTRDFLSPQDLFKLICLVIRFGPFNAAIEAYSSKPVSKFKLLDYFASNYSLRYTVKDGLKLNCPTGEKTKYCPSCCKALKLTGYKPRFSSLETVASEVKYLLGAANE